KGQTAAFGELVRRHQDRLFNTVFRLVDSAEDAQDVVQEAFLHAYQSLDRFKGHAQFFTWLYRIAVNSAISLKRKQRKFVSLHVDREGQGSVPEPHDASERSQPDLALERADEGRRIQAAYNRQTTGHGAVRYSEVLVDQK